MTKTFVIFSLFTLMSCATRTPKTEALLKNSPVRTQVVLGSVPFIEQSSNECGPATLAMVLNYWKKDVRVEDLLPNMMTQKLEGTFQSEMITTPRLHGFMSLPVTNLESVIKEIERGHPVILFQNLGFSFAPKWHYALAVGHDLNGPDFILHTGPKKFERMDMRLVERNWKLADYWGLVVLPPHELAVSLDEKAHVLSAASLEKMGKMKEAETAYKTILKRWPESLLAMIGLGNTHYERKDYKTSLHYLTMASVHHPDAPEVWHNLWTVQKTMGLTKEAQKSFKKKKIQEARLKTLHQDLVHSQQ